ncbi:pilus assembly protein TadG-related protein [Streptomyces sp. NPDC059917]|uniref:pilus assembly protein TadG-related protein n=1 Tax=Streptomyces sp. NPDC059917 TaxID=3347002 RepID=UPI003662AB73
MRGSRDKGQAFPIYIVTVAGLLFAAFAFFAISQAAVVRSNAQKAADAAALAAAGDARDHLLPGLDFTKLKPEDWRDILDGRLFDGMGACGAARAFASDNGATATCEAALPSFTVEATTETGVGNSVVPGIAGTRGTAKATARIDPRCVLGSAPAPGGEPPAEGSPPPKPDPVEILCRGGDVIHFDPSKPDPWRTLARSLFDVRLVH